MAITNADVASAIEAVAPLSLQEEWDNSGFQVGDVEGVCTGVLLCVDVTMDTLIEAGERGCNLIVSHHPLIFRGLKRLIGRNRVERVAAEAFRRGITVYSCHTPVDNAPGGISHAMCRELGLSDVEVLSPRRGDEAAGLGAVGNLPEPLTSFELVEKVKAAFGSPVVRCSCPEGHEGIRRVALCGGAGTEFLSAAKASGAQAFISSDSKLNQFIDHSEDIFLIDIGHYEAEKCAKSIFYRAICEKISNFAVYYSEKEKNPIYYL